MGKSLKDITLLELLPDSIRGDEQVAAAAQAIESELQAINDLAESVAVYASLDTATEPLLSTLAWQLHIDHLEGWALADTDAQKRALIRNSIEAHRYKGTRWSLERLFGLLDMEGTITPWYESGGDPYTFTVDVSAPERGITEQFYSDVEEIVKELKNVRSHLASIIVATSSSGTVTVGAATVGGDAAVVYPFMESEISTPGAVYVGAGIASYDTVTVYTPGESRDYGYVTGTIDSSEDYGWIDEDVTESDDYGYI